MSAGMEKEGQRVHACQVPGSGNPSPVGFCIIRHRYVVTAAIVCDGTYDCAAAIEMD